MKLPIFQPYDANLTNADQAAKWEDIAYCRKAVLYARAAGCTKEEFRAFRDRLANEIITRRYNREYLPLHARSGKFKLIGGPNDGEGVTFHGGLPEQWRTIHREPFCAATFSPFDDLAPMSPMKIVAYERKIRRWCKAWRIQEVVEYHWIN